MDFITETLLASNSFGLYEKALVTFIAFQFRRLTKDVHALRAMVEAAQKADLIKETRLVKLELMADQYLVFKDRIERFLARWGSEKPTDIAP